MPVAGGGFDGDVTHQLAERIDLFAGMGGVGVLEDVWGDEAVESNLFRDLTHGALDVVVEEMVLYHSAHCSGFARPSEIPAPTPCRDSWGWRQQSRVP